MNRLPNAIEPDELLGDDPEVEAAPPPDDADLKTVAQLAERHIELEAQIAALQAELAVKQSALEAIRNSDLPLAMTSLGLELFRLTGGGVIELKEIIAASITKENQPKAFPWLEKNGHGDLIKHVITIQFGKGEDAWAKKFLQDLAKRKRPLKFDRKDTVHPQTLGAFVREQIRAAKAEGLDPRDQLPYDLLGVFQQKYAEVSLPKAKQ